MISFVVIVSSCSVTEMEMDREKILLGLRKGFAAAFDALATDEQLAAAGGSGNRAAEEAFPESCMLSEYDFTVQARERLLEAGVKIYKETDRNSRLLKVLDAASSLATMPIRAPYSLFTKLRDRRRERKLSNKRMHLSKEGQVAHIPADPAS
mmetsp:Transcript_28472/g.45781  ORF Transcript_28472/g.45781 Transcript_28472/m.45781 type:complete len:152 (+) Transcript_28472:1643-2098(+)